MKNCILKIVSTLLFGSMAFAHGMDKLGPHKGIIQMPGAFHTEVVQNKDGSFRIYLLDIEFKNPIIKNSEVKVKIKSGRSTELKCMAMSDYFHCLGTKKATVEDQSELLIIAIRDGAKGNEAIYKLPLKL